MKAERTETVIATARLAARKLTGPKRRAFPAEMAERYCGSSPRLAVEIRAAVEPHSQADPKFQTPLAFTRITSKPVREALLAKSNLRAAEIPAEWTLVTILNRRGDCPKSGI